MILSLSSTGNPDHNQDPNLPMFGCDEDHKIKVKSFKEASEKCREFIEANNLGGSNWTGGVIFENNEQVARVSYNGRVWKAGTERQEIEI